jgi:8-oxo-dGTP diphosphatase
MNPPIAVVAGAILFENKYLIARRREGKAMAGFWEFPGGKIEQGESPYDALEREILEELGIKIHATKVIGTNLHHYPAFSVELILVQAHFVSGEIRLSDHDAFVWVDPKDFQHYVFADADVPFISLLCQN